MIRDADLYFEARLAFSDRPNARIWLREQPNGGVGVYVAEPIPANPYEPDHRKTQPWVCFDQEANREHPMWPQILHVNGTVSALMRLGPGESRPIAAMFAERLRRVWDSEVVGRPL
jgi:hypothetical protein